MWFQASTGGLGGYAQWMRGLVYTYKKYIRVYRYVCIHVYTCEWASRVFLFVFWEYVHCSYASCFSHSTAPHGNPQAIWVALPVATRCFLNGPWWGCANISPVTALRRDIMLPFFPLPPLRVRSKHPDDRSAFYYSVSTCLSKLF